MMKQEQNNATNQDWKRKKGYGSTLLLAVVAIGVVVAVTSNGNSRRSTVTFPVDGNLIHSDAKKDDLALYFDTDTLKSIKGYDMSVFDKGSNSDVAIEFESNLSSILEDTEGKIDELLGQESFGFSSSFLRSSKKSKCAWSCKLCRATCDATAGTAESVCLEGTKANCGFSNPAAREACKAAREICLVPNRICQAACG